jgi:hypothetical protein
MKTSSAQLIHEAHESSAFAEHVSSAIVVLICSLFSTHGGSLLHPEGALQVRFAVDGVPL